MKKILREVFNLIWILKNKIFKNYNVTINATTIFNRDTIFEGYNKIGRFTNVNGSIIGMGSYIGSNCSLHNAKIGRFCSIASNVDIIIGDHPINYVSTHPAFFSNKKQAGFTFATVSNYDELKYVDYLKKYYIEIGNDVWIGQNVKIFQGVKIGSGAIIGSGSMVIRDIEPYSINVGIPSKKIKKRFSDDIVNFLLDFEWWNKDFGWIMKNAILFENVEKFKKQFCSEND